MLAIKQRAQADRRTAHVLGADTVPERERLGQEILYYPKGVGT